MDEKAAGRKVIGSFERRSLLKAEYWRFKDAVEKLSGIKIDTQ